MVVEVDRGERDEGEGRTYYVVDLFNETDGDNCYESDGYYESEDTFGECKPVGH